MKAILIVGGWKGHAPMEFADWYRDLLQANGFEVVIHDTLEALERRENMSSYAGFWVTGPDQAARFSATLLAIPSVNVTPSMTKGNWFAPFRRRHVLAAA